MAEAVQGTAERFDVFADLPPPRFPGGARAALAAAGARDELVRAAGPALSAGSGSRSRCAAAFLQNLRTALQKALTPRVGVLGATYARFLFAVPWAVAARRGPGAARRRALPVPTAAFAAWALVGAVAQIAATLLLLHLFRCATSRSATPSPRPRRCRRRSSGFVLLGDRVGTLALAGILVSLVGHRAAVGDARLAGGSLNRAAAIGLASGAASRCRRWPTAAASLALAGPRRAC